MMKKIFRETSVFCEDFKIASYGKICIINYKKVIKAYMELKKTYAPVCDGVLVIDWFPLPVYFS